MKKPTVMRRETPSSSRTGVLVHTMRDARESKDAVRLRNGRLLGKCPIFATLVVMYSILILQEDRSDQYKLFCCLACRLFSISNENHL